MDASGLRRILKKLRSFNHPSIERTIHQYESDAEDDFEQVVENFNQDVLRDMSNPSDVYNAIMSNVEGTRAYDFFLSAMQHLLLIREEGESRIRYFQLIDRLITSIVLDRKSIDGDFSSIMGVSVNSVVAKFADQDRLQEAITETTELKVIISKLKRDKEALEEEVNQGNDGLVKNLKTRLARTEEDLKISRSASAGLQAKVQEVERSYQERLAEQELQIRELFNMLKEARALETVTDEAGVLNRRELMDLMEKKLQRTKAIHQLEGRHLSRKPTRKDELEVLEEDEGRPGKSPRKSRFEDAEEENVRQHIEETLAAGKSHLVGCAPH